MALALNSSDAVVAHLLGQAAPAYILQDWGVPSLPVGPQVRAVIELSHPFCDLAKGQLLCVYCSGGL